MIKMTLSRVIHPSLSKLLSFILILILFTGCAQTQDTVQLPVTQTVESSEESESEIERLSTAVLVGTRLAWRIPAKYKLSQVDNGFVATDEFHSGFYVKRESTKLHLDGNVNRIEDSVLKSRIYDIVNSQAYNLISSKISKIEIAGQRGYRLNGVIEQNGQESDMLLILLQFDSDIVIIVGTSEEASTGELHGIVNGVVVTKNINVIWEE